MEQDPVAGTWTPPVMPNGRRDCEMPNPFLCPQLEFTKGPAQSLYPAGFSPEEVAARKRAAELAEKRREEAAERKAAAEKARQDREEKMRLETEEAARREEEEAA